MFKYNIGFHKKGDLIFISHLDLMRLFRRAVRRAELPAVLTAGFTPRVKISMPKALKLGVESENEEMTLFLEEALEPIEIQNKLNEELPEGVGVTCVDRGA